VVSVDLKVDADPWGRTLVDRFHGHADDNTVARDAIEDEKVGDRRFFSCECF